MNMQIDRSNYEHFLLDYFEGRLGKQEKAVVKLFLSENPDIAEDFAALHVIKAVPDDLPTSLINTSTLNKSFSDIGAITEINIDEFCIAHYEGDLDTLSEKRLHAYLHKNPAARPTFDFYGDIKLKADSRIHFPDKKAIKKVNVIRLRKTVFRIAAGMAAVVTGILLWFSFLQSHHDPSPGTGFSEESIAESQPRNPMQESGIRIVREMKSAIRSLDEGIIYNNEQAVDSSNPRPVEKIVLAALSPRPAMLETKIPPALPGNILIQNEKIISEPRQQVELAEHTYEKRKLIEKIPSRSDFIFNAVNVSIKGFNTLTESQLALHTSMDNNGKLTEIGIDGENFEFKRKVQRNTQN